MTQLLSDYIELTTKDTTINEIKKTKNRDEYSVC
jgi:hypothetical protein